MTLRPVLLSAAAALLVACASNGDGPALSSVPEKIPSLENDQAKQAEEAPATDGRADELRARIAEMKAKVAAVDPTAKPTDAKPAEASTAAPETQPTAPETKPAEATPAPVAVDGEKKPQPAPEQAAEATPTSQPTPQPAPAEVPVPAEDHMRFYLGEIKFLQNSVRLGTNDLTALDTMINPILQKDIKGTFVVEGFSSENKTRTDEADVTNLMVSVKRAEVVRDALIAQGVPADRIEVRGLGTANPYGMNGSNRRAVIWLNQ